MSSVYRSRHKGVLRIYFPAHPIHSRPDLGNSLKSVEYQCDNSLTGLRSQTESKHPASKPCYQLALFTKLEFFRLGNIAPLTDFSADAATSEPPSENRKPRLSMGFIAYSSCR